MVMESWRSGSLYEKAKPFLAVILLQFGYAGMSLISKFALNRGISHVLVVFRHVVAFLVIAPFAFIFDRMTVSHSSSPARAR
ncbi:hypothetical protein QYF36_015153 [Acer negundo]|nr:hypothetical protein QYF36_015153 [Acer negundo]